MYGAVCGMVLLYIPFTIVKFVSRNWKMTFT